MDARGGVKTLHLRVNPGDVGGAASRRAIAEAAGILRAGGTVAFPTETVYGLGANALDAGAVKKIFAAKERPGWDPVIAHVGDRAQATQVAEEVSQDAHRLMEAFWPGPLTLLLPKHPRIPAIVTAGLARVGVRMPAHPVAAALLREAGVPVAAPSANRFGRISPTTATHVAEDLEGRIDAILDGGETTHGVESTVVEARADGCIVYRPGVITLEQIRGVCGGRAWLRQERIDDENPEAAPAPGMGLRHYAPRARLILVEGNEAQVSLLRTELTRYEEAGEIVGLLLPDAFVAAAIGHEKAYAFQWGRWDKPEELAHRLYAGLRWLDSVGATVILCPMPDSTGIGLAIRDRLMRAGNREQG